MSWVVADADNAVARVTLRGSFRRAYHGLRPTHRRLALAALFGFKLGAGRIIDIQLLYGRATLRDQIGVELPRGQIWDGRHSALF